MLLGVTGEEMKVKEKGRGNSHGERSRCLCPLPSPDKGGNPSTLEPVSRRKSMTG